MTEVELKLQVPPERRARVEREVTGASAATRLRLQASYVDTPDDALAAAGLALRVRREGRQWVQTLKGAAADGMTREEHNVPLAATGAAVPVADPALHADTVVGRRLLAVLQAAGAPLVVRYGTDIWRRTRVVRVSNSRPAVPKTVARPLGGLASYSATGGRPTGSAARGSVELAFDEGHVQADDRRWPILELEIELHAGDPLAVVETARRWIVRHGLWLDTRTKAERGGLLAHGLTMSPPRLAQPLAWRRDMTAAQAESMMLNGCLQHIAANASQVASGAFTDEHVHQLRVALRRLRSGLRLFDDAGAGPIADAAALWFRQLGGARDAVALQPLKDDLQQALDALGLALPAPDSAIDGADAEVDPAELARGAVAQLLMLDIMARAAMLLAAPETSASPGDADGLPHTSPHTSPHAPPLAALLSKRLSHWHRRVVADARRFDRLDDAARHDLRKRVKRLRYAVEFAQPLFEGAATRRYARRLRRLQDALGRVTDAGTAATLWRDGAVDHPGNAFAMGWLLGRRAALVDDCRPAVDRFLKAKRFWKK